MTDEKNQEVVKVTKEFLTNYVKLVRDTFEILDTLPNNPAVVVDPQNEALIEGASFFGITLIKRAEVLERLSDSYKLWKNYNPQKLSALIHKEFDKDLPNVKRVEDRILPVFEEMHKRVSYYRLDKGYGRGFALMFPTLSSKAIVEQGVLLELANEEQDKIKDALITSAGATNNIISLINSFN